MSQWQWCKTCGRYDPVDRHQCPPVFLVLCADWNGHDWDDAQEVYAYNPEAAAEHWAEQRDSGNDYSIVHGNAVTLKVRKKDETEIVELTVTGEMQPVYTAERRP